MGKKLHCLATVSNWLQCLVLLLGALCGTDHTATICLLQVKLTYCGPEIWPNLFACAQVTNKNAAHLLTRKPDDKTSTEEYINLFDN